MEPRTTSRLQRKEAAFEVKAEGNERFRNGRLRSALECYEEAIRMDPSEPVYYANRSTCLFELGEYAAACEDSKQASLLYREKQKIGMISRSDANSLIEKLLRQSARCFLCMNTPESLDAARSLLNRCMELHPDPDKELLSMHAGAVAAVEEAASASAGEASGPGLGASKGAGRACDVLPRYRSPVVNGPTPYSCIGWEVALSGLAGRVASPADTEATFSSKGGTFGGADDDNEGAIDLASRPEGERSLSMLFGGLGDARQVLATFRDLHQQVARSGGRLAFPSVGLSLLLNDVKAECLARAVVMFRALEALGRALQAAGAVPGGCLAGSGGGDADMMMGAGDEMGMGPEGFDEGDGGRPSNAGADPLALLEQSDAVAEAAYRCYHLYLGAFLMPHEADWLQATLDDLVLQQQLQQQQQQQQPGAAGAAKPFAFPWLKVGSPQDLAALRSVVERWRVMCKAMEPAVMARIYQSSMQRPSEDEAGPAGGACGEEMDAGLSLEQQWREQVREAMMEQIECMADEEVEALAEAEGATAAEKRAYLKEHWSREVDPRTLDLMRHLPSAHREIEFFHTTMLLPVPPPEAARRAFASAPGALLDRSQGRALHRLWRPNVTLVCASTPLEAVAGLSEEELASSSKLTELKFCPFKALKLLLMAPGDEGVLPRQEAFRSAALFFSEVALGLVGLIDAGNLGVELYLGDVNELGNRPAGTMDRILLSNVPDYTTLLPPMIKLTPLLKQAPGAALKHSVIKFNSVFRDLPEYAHSMGLYVPDMASLPLYLGINHEYGGLWAHLIEWSRACPQPLPEVLDASNSSGLGISGSGALGDGSTSPKPEVHSLPPAPDQQAWLATVFLSMAMPMHRDSVSGSTEIRPLTLHAFFELCHHLGSRGLFPPHNVAWVIEHAMRGELRTVAVPPDETPWSPHFTWRRHHYQRSLPTGAFALETRTLAGLWQERLGFRLCAPAGQRLPRPEDVIQVRVPLPALEEAWLGRTGLGLAKVVGVALLHPEFCATHERVLDPKNHSFHSPAPSPGGSSPSRLSSQMQEEYEDFVAEEEDREHRLRMGSSDDLVREAAASALSLSAEGKHRPGLTSMGSIRELGAIGGGGLRPLLLDRETQNKGHVHLLSCVRWDSGAQEAALLLDKADLRALAAEGFQFVLLRTDSWLPLCAPFPLPDDPGAACPLPQAIQQQQEQDGMMDVEAAASEQNGAVAAPAASAASPREASGSSGHDGLVAGGVEDDGSLAAKMNRTKTY